MPSLLNRNGIFYVQTCVGGKIRRQSLRTRNQQVAKEKFRRIESRLAQGDDNPLPTRTPIPEILSAYARHIRATKTAKSAQTDLYYLRQVFGPCCPDLEITSRTPSEKAKRRPTLPGKRGPKPIEAACFEAVTTAALSDFVNGMVRARGLAPKTANRYREIVTRLYNWAMKEGRVRLPSDTNPAARVERFREPAPDIRYLTLPQIDEQLTTLAHDRRLQTMVALYIYAGLRREEALWLTLDDLDLRPLAKGGFGMIRVRAKTVGGRSWQPKTKVNRAVPVSSVLARFLLAWKPEPTAERWLFPSPAGKWWDPDNFSRDLRAAQKPAGLKWGCLDYRHTFGSQLAQKGVSLYKIATLMGNSPEICRRHYAALCPEAMGEEVEFTSNRNLCHRQIG
jgi:integrase